MASLEMYTEKRPSDNVSKAPKGASFGARASNKSWNEFCTKLQPNKLVSKSSQLRKNSKSDSSSNVFVGRQTEILFGRVDSKESRAY